MRTRPSITGGQVLHALRDYRNGTAPAAFLASDLYTTAQAMDAVLLSLEHKHLVSRIGGGMWHLIGAPIAEPDPQDAENAKLIRRQRAIINYLSTQPAGLAAYTVDMARALNIPLADIPRLARQLAPSGVLYSEQDGLIALASSKAHSPTIERAIDIGSQIPDAQIEHRLWKNRKRGVD